MATKKIKPAEAEAEVTENVASVEAPKLSAWDIVEAHVKDGLHTRIYFEAGKYLDKFIPNREFSKEEVLAMTHIEVK